MRDSGGSPRAIAAADIGLLGRFLRQREGFVPPWAPSMTRPLRAFRQSAILFPLGLFAFALLLRLIGVDWGGTHPDEDIGGPARILAGDLRPRSFYYPPLLTYAVAAAYIPLFGVGSVLGWWQSLAEFRAAYFDAPTPFFVTARIVVALFSAAAAPIAYALARQLNLSKGAALLTGVVAAVLPGAVYWAHIAKADSAIGPALLLVSLCALRVLDRPQSLVRAALLGLALAIAVSFKHSAIFFLAPALVIFGLWSLRSPATRWVVVRSWLIALLVAATAGAILNIGILIDLDRFFEAQVVQSQMSYREAPADVTMRMWITQLLSANTGMPALAMIAALALCVLGLAKGNGDVRLLLAVLAIAWIVGTSVILSITGSRQPEHLWLPYLVVAFVAASIGAGALTDTRSRRLQSFGYVGFALLLVSAAFRVFPILTQATSPPTSGAVAAILRDVVPKGAKIMSSIDLGGQLPLSPESQILPRARHERLAKKYDVVLPPADRPVTGTPGGYTVIDYPWVIGGLESYGSDEVKIILPYAWPIQPEEWQLERQIADGFHFFVVQRMDDLVNSPVPAYRAFFRALDQCRQVASVPALRPLFGEAETRVYECV